MRASNRIVVAFSCLLSLAGCDGASQVFFASSTGGGGGHVVIMGAAPLVPLEGAEVSSKKSIPVLLADHQVISTFETQSVANEVSMERLCSAHEAHPDFALLTRSPTLSEIRRCERAGINISADLLATNDGEWVGYSPFEQVWIAYIPGELENMPSAARAVEALRYEFGTLIEGSEYAEVFVARRG